MTRFWQVAAILVPVLAMAASGPASPAAAAIPVVLDTDIGDDIDDTWALALLLRSPELDVKLVTTTCGQAEYRAKLIAKLLTVAGRTDIPIGLGEGGRGGAGRQQAWVRDYRLSDYAGKIHDDGAGALIDVVERSPRPVSIIAIGPLHTLAKALERRPGLAAKAAFVGMHGSIRKGYGNSKKPAAEYNVKANVPAAQKVFSAPWRHITITPLDTCGLVDLSGDRFQTLKRSSDPLVRAVLENYRIWAGKKSIDELRATSTLFDPVAVYLALPGPRSLVTMEVLPIAVTPDGFTRIASSGAKMSVATAWEDLDGFRDLLVARLLRRVK